MESLLCTLINVAFGAVQAVINVLFAFWSLLGIAPPDLSAPFGSLFGCNL